MDIVFQTKKLARMLNSLDGNRYAQVFYNRIYFSEIYATSKEADAGKSMRTFVMELGVYEELTFDGSK